MDTTALQQEIQYLHYLLSKEVFPFICLNLPPKHFTGAQVF